MKHIEKWKRIDHPNVVALRKVFTTRNEFRETENSLVFVHDFYPNAETLLDFLDRRGNRAAENQHYQHRNSGYGGNGGNKNKFYPESTVWSFIVQLSSVIKEVHGKGLAFRTLHDMTKVLVLNGGRRFRVSCVGVADVIRPADPLELPLAQDLVSIQYSS